MKKLNRKEIERTLRILKERGVEVAIGGCGCLDSPWIAIKLDGELIHHSENQNIVSPGDWPGWVDGLYHGEEEDVGA